MTETNNEQFLFERLKAIREKKDISLESIADKYRVQLKYLKALEAGDLISIPEVYDKLFFRSYIKALDLNEEDYYDEFIDYRRSIRLDKTTSVFDFSQEEKREKNILNYRNLFVILPFFVIAIVVVILINNTEMIDPDARQPVDEIDVQDVVRNIEQKEQMRADSIAGSIQTGDSLVLQIIGQKRTWFRVVTDAVDTNEYLFYGNESIQISATDQFEFLIGRADGLQFNLNGTDLPAVGADSSVVRYLKIDSTGIAATILKQE